MARRRTLKIYPRIIKHKAVPPKRNHPKRYIDSLNPEIPEDVVTLEGVPVTYEGDYVTYTE